MSAILIAIKRTYRKASVREKLLIASFIIVLMLIWISSLLGRFSDWNTQRNSNATELLTQQQWLDRSDEFGTGLAKALERVEPGKTYSSTQLSTRIDSLLRESELATRADINPVRTREGEIFDDHNVRVELRRISISQLIQFNNLIKQDTPYINLESVRIQKNRNKPEELDVRYEINSFELKDAATL